MTVENKTSSQHVEDLYHYLGEVKSRGGQNIEYVKAVLENNEFRKICMLYELIGIANSLPRPRDSHVSRTLGTLQDALAASQSEHAQELSCLLEETYVSSFVGVISKILLRDYDVAVPPQIMDIDEQEEGQEKVRIIGLHKAQGEALGITLKKTKEGIVIARILHGGLIGRQGLLSVGDVILEVNGAKVSEDPGEVQLWLTNTSGSLMLTILPSFNPAMSDVKQLFVRAFFDYDPAEDEMCPSKEFGLAFKFGEILQVVNKDDDNWWQAVRVHSENESEKPRQAGLIPSIVLQERRRAFVSKKTVESAKKMKKRKIWYSAQRNADFDRHSIPIYEELARMPPFQRKTMVLVGSDGAGKDMLVSKLLTKDPERLATPMPHTSRRQRDGEDSGAGYWFAKSRKEMEDEFLQGKYLEFGEYESNLYGTKLDSVRAVMRSGKTCVLSIHPQSLKTIRTPEFMPFVVFVTNEQEMNNENSDSRPMYEDYRHYFDLMVYLDPRDLEASYTEVRQGLKRCELDHQWVPVSWVY